MNIREIIKIFPHYRIFKSLTHPKRYYAILQADVQKMESLMIESIKSDNQISDSLKVKALPLLTADNDFYDVFDHSPTLYKINDLVEVLNFDE